MDENQVNWTPEENDIPAEPAEPIDLGDVLDLDRADPIDAAGKALGLGPKEPEPITLDFDKGGKPQTVDPGDLDLKPSQGVLSAAEPTVDVKGWDAPEGPPTVRQQQSQVKTEAMVSGFQPVGHKSGIPVYDRQRDSLRIDTEGQVIQTRPIETFTPSTFSTEPPPSTKPAAQEPAETAPEAKPAATEQGNDSLAEIRQLIADLLRTVEELNRLAQETHAIVSELQANRTAVYA